MKLLPVAVLTAAIVLAGCNPAPNNPAPPQKNGPAGEQQSDRPGFNKEIIIGGVGVTVTAADVRKPIVEKNGQSTEFKTAATMFTVRIRVLDAGRKFNYERWTLPQRKQGVATLTDDKGNKYKPLNFYPVFDVQGAMRGVSESLIEGRVVDDVLLFDEAPTGIGYFDLDLPEPELGGTFRFRVPRPK